MQITIYNKRDGKILSNLDVPAEAIRLQTRGKSDLAHLLGWWPSDKYRIERGVPVETGPLAPAQWQVRQEASRRIESAYPSWKQLNILRTGTPDEINAMGAYIDAVRAASNRMDPAPNDYTDDKHWPSLDESTRTL